MRGFVLAVVAGITACAPKYDPVRVGVDEGTLGARIVTLLCKRLAFQADPTDVSGDRYREACRGGPAPEGAPLTIVAITAHRARIVAAVDAVVPEDAYEPLQAYLTSPAILGLYDDDTMAGAIASLGDLLAEIGADDAAAAAFARQGARAGYRPAPQAIGPAGPLTGSPHLRAVLDHVLPTLLEGGAAHEPWTALTAAISATLLDAAAPADAASPTRTAGIAGALLLTEHARLAEAAPLSTVRRDGRGVARVALVGGEIPAPFADLDGDGLADVDAQGRFVDTSGAPLAAPAPFHTTGDTAARDDRGRAIDAAGRPIYDYLGVDRTLIGAMAHDQRALLDPDRGTALDLLRGAALLLGERAPRTRTFDGGAALPYRGWDIDAGSPLLDLAHAFAQLLRDPNIRDLLALADELFTNHEPATARLIEAAVTAARLGDAHPEAQILTDAPLWDDLLAPIRQIVSNPALMRDLVRALRRPEVRQLADRFRELMTYKDRFDIAADQSVTGALATMPDRNAPDSGFNRSLFQRLLHVINDTNGALECSKAGAQLRDPTTGLPLHTFANACDFYRINNTAVFYLQTMAYAKDAAGNYLCETAAGAFGNTQPAATPEGCAALGRRPRPKASFNYNWPALVRPLISVQGGDAYLEGSSTITGLRTHPSTAALNRALFLTPRPQLLTDLSEPPRDKFGELLGPKHAGTLPVWEKHGFFDQIRPLAQAFADHNAEQIFVDLLAALHKHWSSKQSTSTQHTSPTAPNYTYGSNAVSFEPLIAAVMQADLWPALTESATELEAITANGKTFATILGGAGRFLTTPLPGLADRRGATATTTSDGRPVATLTPFHLLADAQVRKRARLAAQPALAATWTESVPALVDLWLRGEQASGAWRFKSRTAVAAALGLTALLRGRIDEHDAAGDRAAWLAAALPKKLEDFFTHPILAAAADLVEAQTASPAGRRALELLLYDALEPGTPAFDTMRVAAADLVQLAQNDAELVPLAHLAGRLIAPDRAFLPTQLAFLSKLHGADPAAVMTGIVARLFRPFDAAADPGIPAISAIADGVGEVDRALPTATAPPWSAADYRAVFSGVGGFLRDERHGLPRFITIVKGRSL